MPSPRIAHENQIDLLRCPRCGSEVRTIAAITDPAAIAELLRHFGLSSEPPSSGGTSPRAAGNGELTYHPL